MNQLVFKNNGQIVTSSRNVARDFGKGHREVLRAIDDIVKTGVVQNCTDLFYETTYIHEQNKQEYREYLMNRDGFTLLVMGFTGKKAMQFKLKYVQAFNLMEKQLKELIEPSYMIEDPIKRAERWIVEQKEKKQLEIENKELKQKASYVDQILQSTNTVTISQIAEDYGMTAQQMNKLLNEFGIQYKLNKQWLLYSVHKGKGYTKSHTVDITHKNGQQSVAMHTKWTQKGRLFIYETLKNRGVLPLVDIQLNKTKRLQGVS